jgi:hypothetical protein
MPSANVLKDIRRLVESNRYEITAHAVKRSIERGVGERDIVSALMSATHELLGTTPETVSRWENGQRDIPRPVMALTAAVALERMSGERDELRARLERYGREPAKRLSA